MSTGAAAKQQSQAQVSYKLRLFVAGHTQKSTRAVHNITQLCQNHLSGHYDLEVVDLYQQPELAAEHQLVAAPTLLKILPLPPKRMIGDLSNWNQVLIGLGLSR
jgi:circadian clock protein KaiB